MLRTEPMAKIRVISIDASKAAVVAALHAIGAIDLRKSSLNLGDDRPADNAADLSDALIRVSGALQLLARQPVAKEGHRGAAALAREARAYAAIDETYSLGNERKSLNDDLKAVGYAERVAQLFSGSGINFSRMASDYVAYSAFETDKKGAQQFIRAAKGHKANGIEVKASRSGKKFAILVVHSKSVAVDELMKGVKANELDLTAKYLTGTCADVMRSMSARRKDDATRLRQIAERLAALSRKHYSRLFCMREMLEIELARAEASSMFKRTESTFIIEGWVQKRHVDMVLQKLSSVTNGRAYLEELHTDELAPTHTRRPKFLRPFDYLVGFYSLQRSDEIDPTWIFIISFPIFYGLMVTDVGYGIASLILATLITRRTDPDGLMYNAAKVWQLNSFAAMAFGVLSNQYFGFQLGYVPPFHFDWLQNTPELIAITVLFGVAQVILGLVIGIVNSYGHGHKKIAVARFTSILVVAFGTIAVAGAFFGAFNALIAEISGAIAVVSLLLTGVLSGSEATEITNLITHPLSYARLMGFGLGSVIIAFLIDMAFTPSLANGIPMFILFGVIFVLLHFLNMILSIFEGIVQGVRLNFVEFFSKFYLGNGIPFRPFGYKRVHTKE